MTLAEKHYQEHRDHPQNVVCCKCLRLGAHYHAGSGYDTDKADDCNDANHSETCWLCKRCLREIGAEW